jgi:cell division protein FtsB
VGLRAVFEEQAPRAEEMAARYVEQTRPVWSWIALEWRRVATVAVLLLTVGVVLHAMFGANGMVVYQQKRAERQTLQSEVMRLQKENDEYVERIKALKTDHRAIEKEAREQLHYTRPGEFVYVAPEAPAKPPVGRAKNDE